MSGLLQLDELFERRIIYPDSDYQQRLSQLVGLDEHKERIAKIIGTAINPQGLNSWVKKFHPHAYQLGKIILNRPPLVIFSGDVGSGKTELAESIGDAVARQENIDITLFPLSLSTRGQGRVGEMTQLISAAFEHTVLAAEKLKRSSGKALGGIILLVDEADAITQSRENSQMHHEDRAGVNAFIRGIDRLSNSCLPASVIMCTNRLNALDPAVKRRAADILIFTRPNDQQREFIITNSFQSLGFSKSQINTIVKATGVQKNREYGFTFSDLNHRLLPAIILDAYPNQAICPERALEIAVSIIPTPPFQENKI
jgi:AAA+ superfamily predicted ATPase